MVMVNAKHPAIQEQLRELLERAESSFDENGRFSMDVRFHFAQCFFRLFCRSIDTLPREKYFTLWTTTY